MHIECVRTGEYSFELMRSSSAKIAVVGVHVCNFFQLKCMQKKQIYTCNGSILQSQTNKNISVPNRI